MKHIVFLLAFSLAFGFLSAQSKKELKALEKKFQVYDAGKAFKKAKQICLPGVNLRFKTASRETAIDGRHQEQVKFSTWAVLEGLKDEDFQDITDAFQVMLTEKFTAMGLEVLPPSAYANNKGYLKLLDKNTKDRLTVKKNWGVAQVFSADERPFFVFPMTPLGAQAKFAKTADALVTNLLITIDFAYIGFETTRYKSRYAFNGVSASSTIVPVIRLEGMTENQLQVRTDGTYIHVVADQNSAHQLTLRTPFHSEVEFATGVEACQSCMPSFAKGFWADMVRNANNTGTFRVTTTPAQYKAAVLDALDRFSDDWVKIYAAQRK